MDGAAVAHPVEIRSIYNDLKRAAVVDPRVITPPYAIRLTSQRETWTKEAEVRLIYSTSTPYDFFKITATDPLAVANGAAMGRLH